MKRKVTCNHIPKMKLIPQENSQELPSLSFPFFTNHSPTGSLRITWTLPFTNYS